MIKAQQHSESATLSRRDFCRLGALGAFTVVAWPRHIAASALTTTDSPSLSIGSVEQRTIMHFLNMIMPGDDGQLLFTGDGYPLKSGGDRTAGAWSAGALDVLYDPYYGVAGANASLLAGALDTAARLRGYGTSFFELSQAQQVEIVDYLSGHEVVGEVLRHAARIVMTATLGAAKSDSVTQLIGWPGPNGGYYSAARHPLILWRQPSSMTQDGNLA